MLTVLATLLALVPGDAQVKDLRDGFVRVETKAYSFEIPKGWSIGSETPWGARDLKPANGKAVLGAMTAGPSQAGWDQLYRTSLWFIQREEEGKATPYTVKKTTQGYEACTFSVHDKEGFAKRRYVLLKHPSGKVLALSVKIPDRSEESNLAPVFDRFVSSAKIH